jgi:predicted RNA binding protein YcfA (HicA-like mRNA interferase family)/predicted RNase H-like HicB family nuclease
VKVREVIRMIENDGWALVRTRGSHRQYRHPVKLGLVTVPGKPGDDLAPGTLNSVFEASGVEMKKYLIVIEQTETGFSAYSPDLPGCVSTGATREEVERNMREAIAFHLDGLREDGQAVPEPHSYSAYVELPA